MNHPIKSTLCLIILSLLLTLTACNQPAAPSAAQNAETTVKVLTLPPPLDTPNAEISGLTWAGDWLILLPQYPQRFEDHLFRIHKTDILEAVSENSGNPLPIKPILIDTGGLEKAIPGFEGFEAIVVNENTAYLTIEASPAAMQGYLVRGEFSEDYARLTLEANLLTPLEPQAKLSNMSDETLLVFGRRLVTLYEANGINVNPQPKASLINFDLEQEDQLSLPNIEYRITDASSVDENGRFWVINYFYPGDKQLNPGEDIFTQTYGEGETHSQSVTVERLLELQFTEDGIVPAETAPIQLTLLPNDEARNWEGLVRLDDLGFLMATDKYPETLLAFIPFP